jgi:hypothetical protein
MARKAHTITCTASAIPITTGMAAALAASHAHGGLRFRAVGAGPFHIGRATMTGEDDADLTVAGAGGTGTLEAGNNEFTRLSDIYVIGPATQKIRVNFDTRQLF